MRFPIAFTLLLVGLVSANAQSEVTLIAPVGIKAALEQLFPGYESQSGHKVKATFGSGLTTKKQVADGQPFDVPVVQVPFPEVLASGNVIASSATPLASIAVGVAVKKGTKKPDISTADAVKRMLLSANSVAYPDPSRGAAAGVSFDKTLKQLGIAEQIGAKLKRAQGGFVAMEMVAKGEVEVGLTFMSEMDNPNIDIVGPLPKDISPPTALVGFVSTHAKDASAAKTLLEYLSSPKAAAAYRKVYMEPAHE